MTTYLGLTMLQEPFDFGPDENGRARVGFNVLATKHASTGFLEELFELLVNASVADRKDIYGSSNVSIPKSGSLIIITESGGTGPIRTHNEALPPYRRPSAQIIAIADTYDQARTMASAAYDALVVVTNQDVIPT